MFIMVISLLAAVNDEIDLLVVFVQMDRLVVFVHALVVVARI